MTIHKFLRLCSLTVASLFWASCSSDSNPQFPVFHEANPDSSSDANGNGSNEESSSSTVALESSSSEALQQSSSSEFLSSSPSGVESSSSANSSSSSSSASSSSSIPTCVLARNPSVTCRPFWYTVSICSKDYNCGDLKKNLTQKQSVSESLLTHWEEGLETCGAVIAEFAPSYGIGMCATTRLKHAMKCSNDSTYGVFKIDGNLAYTSENEYNEAHGIVPEDLVESCPQDDFALFADILAEVQKVLYEKIVNQLANDSSLTESQKTYLENLLDHENKTLKDNFAPYRSGYEKVEHTLLDDSSEFWFDGYIAKTKTCPDGTPETTKRYQEKYDAILTECIEIIEMNIKNATADE